MASQIVQKLEQTEEHLKAAEADNEALTTQLVAMRNSSRLSEAEVSLFLHQIHICNLLSIVKCRISKPLF